jgi:hypothetical protein
MVCGNFWLVNAFRAHAMIGWATPDNSKKPITDHSNPGDNPVSLDDPFPRSGTGIGRRNEVT